MAERILVVEDSRGIREWVVAHLRQNGFIAAGVGDGIEAWKVIASSPPDAVVLDLQIPGMNGVELLRRLRAAPVGRDMPVIIITGVYKGREHAQKARQIFKVDAYLEKPFNIETLIKALKRAINSRHIKKVARLEVKKVSSNDLEKQKSDVEKPVSAGDEAGAAPRPVAADKAAISSDEPAVEGELARTPFDVLLLKLWRERHTGILRVSSPDDEGNAIDRRFAFLSGQPVLGRSNADDDDFGSHLLSRGVASPAENREYQYLRARGERDAEEIFIRMGCFTPDGYIVERVRHLEELLIRCFDLTEGDFRLEESGVEIAAVAGANVPRVLHEGYRRHLSERRQGELFREMAGKYLCRAVKYYDYLPSLELDDDEAKFVREISGCQMLKDHAEDGNFHKALKTAASLLALGMARASDKPETKPVEAPYPIRKIAPAIAETDGPASPEQGAEHDAFAEEGAFEDLGAALSDELGDLAGELEDLEFDRGPDSQIEEEHKNLEKELHEGLERMKNLNYYEYFDSKPNRFKFEDIKKSYFEKRKRFSPENFIEWAAGETISKAEQVFSQLTTAYNTLSNVVSKEKYDELLEDTSPKVTGDAKEDRFQAQVQFESGKAFIEMAEWDSAREAFQEAIDLNQHIANYRAWLAWAIYNKDKHNAANAKKELTQAFRMDPRCAIAFAFKGSMMLDEGRLDNAEIELRRALKYNPRSAHAKKELKILRQRRENEKKGLLGRIFS